MDEETPHLAAATAPEPVATPESDLPEPTKASAWFRPPASELVELPSGNTARLRKPSLLTMMRQGQIPNHLSMAAVTAATGEASPDYARTAELIEFMVIAAFVEPEVVADSPGEGQLSIDQVSDQDKTFVMGWVQSEARAVESFRDDGSGVAGGGDGGDVRDQAEPAA